MAIIYGYMLINYNKKYKFKFHQNYILSTNNKSSNPFQLAKDEEIKIIAESKYGKEAVEFLVSLVENRRSVN